MHSFPEQCGLLVVGHGSREAVGVREFLAAVEAMRGLATGVPIESCFLEFAQPTIAEGFDQLVAHSVRHVIVVPVLLFAAGHAKRDIPDAVAAAARHASSVTIRQAQQLGSETHLLALSRLRTEEVLLRRSRPADPAIETVNVLVGRGSLDPEATAEMHAFAEARQLAADPELRLSRTEVAFVAMAEPRLPQVLQRLAASPPKRIVVQPHLLFGGVLLDRIADTVRDIAAQHPQHEWLLADHLGPNPLLAQALLARAAGAVSK